MNLQPTFQNSVLLPWYLSFITDIILVPGWYIGVSMLPFFKESKNVWLDIFTELHTELIETREEARAARPAEKLRFISLYEDIHWNTGNCYYCWKHDMCSRRDWNRWPAQIMLLNMANVLESNGRKMRNQSTIENADAPVSASLSN